MALTTKYDFEFTSIDGDVINIAIQQDNFGGTKRTIALADVSPVVITWQGSATDKENPILGSSATIRFIASDNYEFQEFFYAKDQEYKVIIQKNSTNYWLGWVVAGQYNEPFEKDMYSIELLCTDGLGDLDNIPLRDSSKDPLTGQYTFGGIIQECLTTNNPLGLDICDSSELFVDAYTITTANNYRYRVTLTGTSGTANIAIKGTNYLATFSTDLATTASNFESSHSVNIGLNEEVGVNAPPFLDYIDFVSPYDFTCTITNATGDLDGTVSREFDSALGNITLRVDGLSNDGNIPNEDGKELWTCGEALRQILLFIGCRLFQSEGKWVIQDILRDENHWQKQHGTNVFARANGQTYINPVRYNKYVGTGDIYPINAGGNLSVIPGYDKINLSYNTGYKENFLSGGFIDSDFSSSTELNDWVRASGSHYAIFSTDWNTTTLTINKTEEAEDISCEINGINTEAVIVTTFADNGGGNLQINTKYNPTSLFAVNDVIFLDYGPTGEDGNYYGYHTITAVNSGNVECNGTAFTSDDSEGGCAVYHYFNSSYLEQQVNPQDTTTAKTFDDQDGQELEIKIRYKVQNSTDTQRDDYEYHIPIMVAVDTSTDQYIDFNKEWSTDSKSFYRIIGNELNTYQEETIKVSLDNLSITAGTLYIAVGQLTTLNTEGYSNTTGYLISDITAKLTPSDLSELSDEKEINSNYSDSLPTKEVSLLAHAGNSSLSFISGSSYSSNSAFVSNRHIYDSEEGTIAANGFANQDKQDGQDLDEWHEYRYKKMYAHNSIQANYEFKENDRAISIEPIHFIQDNQILGRRFLITSLSKDLKENIGSLEMIEIKPREDIYDCISGTVNATNHVIYEPNHFIGPPEEINEFVNIVEPFNVTSEQVARPTSSLTKSLNFDSNDIPYIEASEGGFVPYQTSSTAFQFTQPYTVTLVVNVSDTIASDTYLFNTSDGTTTTGAIILNNDTVYIDGGTKVSSALSINTDEIVVITALFNGASSKVWVNNTASSTISAGTDQGNGAALMNDNVTSGGSTLNHKWYGTYIYNGSLSDDDVTLITNKLRGRTQADRIGLTLEIDSSTPAKINFTFDRSVTGFNTTGLTLIYKNAVGATRTITASSQSGSGTSWTVDLSGDLFFGDVVYLKIDDINGATTTDGGIIYPGIYPITNNLSDEDPDATSWLDSLTATPTTAEREAVSDLYKELKASANNYAELYDLHIYYTTSNMDEEAALRDFTDERDFTKSASVSFTAKGGMSSGTGFQIIDSNWDPETDGFGVNDSSMGIMYSTVQTNNAKALGIRHGSGSPDLYIQDDISGSRIVFKGYGGAAIKTSKNMSVNKLYSWIQNSGFVKGYEGGTEIASIGDATKSTGGLDHYDMAQNGLATPTSDGVVMATFRGTKDINLGELETAILNFKNAIDAI